MSKPRGPRDALALLTPNSIKVEINGKEVRIAANKMENAVLSMLMVGQMRATFEENLKNYQDKEVTFTPRELRDLAAAARDISAFSAEVYNASDPIADSDKRTERKADKTDDIIDFGGMIKKPDDGKATEKPLETDGQPPAAEPPGTEEHPGQSEVLPVHGDGEVFS